MTDLFEQFFLIYPKKRRDGREASYKAWVKACKKTEPEIILSAAIAYAESDPGEYAKGTCAWLNAERYLWDWTPASQRPRKMDKSVYLSLTKKKRDDVFLSDAERKYIRDYEASVVG